jgi:hypothetical protein
MAVLAQQFKASERVGEGGKEAANSRTERLPAAAENRLEQKLLIGPQRDMSVKKSRKWVEVEKGYSSSKRSREAPDLGSSSGYWVIEAPRSLAVFIRVWFKLLFVSVDA